MRKVPAAKVVTTVEAAKSPLPPQIQETLGELVGAAREACSRCRSVSASASFTS